MKWTKRLLALAPAVAIAFVLAGFSGVETNVDAADVNAADVDAADDDTTDVDTQDDFMQANIAAKMGEDGTAYIPLADGTCIEIDDDVAYAVLTADREHIVVRLEDGTLYVTDSEQKNSETISDDCDNVCAVSDEGVFYQDDKENGYRYLFSDGRAAELGEVRSYVVSDHGLSVLYTDYDGNVYALGPDSEAPDNVGTYQVEDIRLRGISDDASVALWYTHTEDIDEYEDINTYYVFNAGVTEELYSSYESYYYAGIDFTEDQGLAVIYSYDSDSLWIVRPGEEIVTARLGSYLYDNMIYTENGLLTDEDSSDVTSLYASVESNSYSGNVYNVSLSGERERVLSNVTYAEISNGIMIWSDEDYTLYCAELDGARLSDETEIASDICDAAISGSGNYVCYINDWDSYGGTLYCYDVENDETQKIGSNVMSVYSSYCINAADEDALYFYQDIETIYKGYHNYSCGVLMKWAPGDESPTKIGSDVILGSVSSGLASGELLSDGITYMKYVYVDDDGNVCGNWMYYDGTEAVKVAEDVIW